MFSSIKNWTSNPEVWLAIIVGLTLSVGVAPAAYWVYFQKLGWPHPYITHTGPLWGTAFGDQLCFGNLALLCAFPLLTWLIAAIHRKRKIRAFFRLCWVLPFVQIGWGLFNMVLLLGLLE